MRGAGERRIREHEAETVRRIFRDYANGKSPRTIARELNAQQVPGPDGRPWIDTTIRGQSDRGTGILNNTIYVGKLGWNRCSYVKDPQTGKRVARPNPESEWEVVEVPELRVVDDAVWEQAKARQTASRFEIEQDDGGNALNRVHRRQFLLSGLLTCGCCGGGYTVVAKDRYGCATRRGKGTCGNSRTIDRHRIEGRVLGGIKERLLAPELVADFVRAYGEELAAVEREADQQKVRAEIELADVERRLNRVLAAVEAGAFNEALRGRLDELERRKAEVKAAIAAAAQSSPPARLHPASAELYQAQVAELEAALNDPDFKTEAAEILRGLIARVVLSPDADAPDGLRAELYGDLAEVLALAASAERRGACGSPPARSARLDGGQLSLVAGAGFGRKLTLPAVGC